MRNVFIVRLESKHVRSKGPFKVWSFLAHLCWASQKIPNHSQLVLPFNSAGPPMDTWTWLFEKHRVVPNRYTNTLKHKVPEIVHKYISRYINTQIQYRKDPTYQIQHSHFSYPCVPCLPSLYSIPNTDLVLKNDFWFQFSFYISLT